MCAQDVFIVLFALFYIRQYQTNRREFMSYALARLLQGVLWCAYAAEVTHPHLLFAGRTAIGFGIALESYCLIAASRGPSKRNLALLLGLASASAVFDAAFAGSPQLQKGIGNLITSAMLYHAWILLAFGRRRTGLQRLTGWLIFGRGGLILLGALVADFSGVQVDAHLKVYLNSIVASVTLFLPMVFLFLLKEQDDRLLQEQQQEILERNESLRASNATKDRLFSIISHDLRSPFNSILGLLEIMSEQVKERNYAHVEAFTRTLYRSAHQAYDLLENLLHWARLQQDRLEFSPEPLRLKEVVLPVIKLHESNVSEKRLQVQELVPDDLTVSADRLMVQTVLRNLLANAIKFTPPEGRIRIEAKRENNEVEISVSDTGAGMSREQLAGLFKVEQGKTGRGNHVASGTGLGLIICKEFIDLHGGRILVQSVEEQGSTFTVVLPDPRRGTGD